MVYQAGKSEQGVCELTIEAQSKASIGFVRNRARSIAIAQAITDEKEEIAAIEVIIDKIFRA